MIVLHTYLPIVYWLHYPWTYIGTGLVFLGFLLASNSVLLFLRNKTPLHPGVHAKFLITEGIYRFTRNPIYVGMIISLLGIALFLGSSSPLLVIPVFSWIIHTRFVLREEKWMEEWFGEDYLEYKRKTRRWL